MRKSEISKETIKKYKERIESAEILLKVGNYNDSVSRTYYALFDAITGLLELEGHGAKSHRGAIAKFHDMYIKSGKIDKRFSRTVGRMVKMREEADYSFKLDIKKDEAKKALADVKELLKTIEKILIA